MPSSPNVIFNIYDVPEEIHPKIRKFSTDISKLNSSVNGERNIKNAPTQNPTHIEHLNNSPSFPLVGRQPLNMLP